jgi:methionine-R-sulfoxide reductase
VKQKMYSFCLCLLMGCDNNSSYKELTQEEYYIIVEKGTEARYSGKYNEYTENGTYSCKRCSLELFDSRAKFDSKSGWPSFDESINQNVKRKNSEKAYTEITCNRCAAHIGHVMLGEKFTSKNTRYCANSLALEFKLRQK